MTSPERPDIDWDTIQRVADKAKLSRLESLSDKELDAELRRMGIDPEDADQMVREALAKAGKTPASGPELRVVGGTGGKAPARSARTRVLAWVSGSVAATAAAAGLLATLLAEPGVVSAPNLPPESVEKLRAEAAAACAKQSWAECAKKLDEARAVDPDGEGDPGVVEERKAIAEHLH